MERTSDYLKLEGRASTMAAMRVAVVERQEIVRRGLAAMLSDTDVEVVAWPSVAEAADHAQEHGPPDVVLISSHVLIEEGDAVQTVLDHERRPPRNLVLVASTDPTHLRAVTRRPTNGFLLLSEITHTTLRDALRRVLSVDLELPKPLAQFLLEGSQRALSLPPELGSYLSNRERDVLRLLTDGMSNKQIAIELGISTHGVKRHVSNILNKFGSPSRTHLIATLLRSGIDPRPSLA